jgi:hypothetical protein
MATPALLRRAALAAVALGAVMAAALQPEATLRALPQDQDPAGHYVLVVEGSVLDLRVTHAVAKQDPWAGAPKGLVSEFELLARDAADKELARVPVDLSKFETDPAKVDAPVVVNGCEVKSPRIGILLNIPALDGAARYEFVRRQRAIGSFTQQGLLEMAGRTR